MDNSWTVVTDPEERTPYAHKKDQWIGFDDIDSIIRKVRKPNHGFIKGRYQVEWLFDNDHCPTLKFD
jgi:hypothetical protein